MRNGTFFFFFCAYRCPLLVSIQSTPSHPISLIPILIFILLSVLRYSKWYLFFWFSLIYATYPAHLILDLIKPVTLARSTIMKLHHAVLSSLLLLPPPLRPKLFFSAPYLQTPLALVLPIMLQAIWTEL